MERLFEPGERQTGRTPVPASEGPLAVRMRPSTLDDLVGQEHLLAPGAALRTAIEAVAADTALMPMFVPAAIPGDDATSTVAGSRMFPRTSPTRPPARATRKHHTT